jgi:hypothetical protein
MAPKATEVVEVARNMDEEETEEEDVEAANDVRRTG